MSFLGQRLRAPLGDLGLLAAQPGQVSRGRHAGPRLRQLAPEPEQLWSRRGRPWHPPPLGDAAPTVSSGRPGGPVQWGIGTGKAAAESSARVGCRPSQAAAAERVTVVTARDRGVEHLGSNGPARRRHGGAPRRRGRGPMFAQSITHDHPWPYRTARELAAPTPWARSREGLARAVAAVSRWRRLRREARWLMALDDRMLRDIGLSRGGIERAVRAGRP